ncbi:MULTISPECIES: hypothetical protein [unclassified Pseudoalteromonas]|uniref:hypothetical protein n=1 Tax=unclassified Pseudoalteromonas TaxID=194690 RepID=UPI00209741E5|nr:hypothetical protein [Pseudoalteromonas sp. XMcav2-N]MCO7189548.1 hypothetical protein [Pseudoalteromonas sp. XMcav2-N]
MIRINFSPLTWLPDEKVKVNAANKQMQELVSRLADAPKYHTLTTQDRQQLIDEGYAADLVDNLVFITLRTDELGKDVVTSGFNYAAFDTSLFSSAHLRTHLAQLNRGCCAYCESYLSATDGGKVGHFRPVELLETEQESGQSTVTTCSPYYSQAYEQRNLLFVCEACHEQHKGGRFPLAGLRLPAISIEQEQPLLINPYEEDPRLFIRFDPVTGRAYPFDLLAAFLMDTRTLHLDGVAKEIWSHPDILRHAPDFHQLPEFTSWFHSLDKDRLKQLSKGQNSIQLLGLNRPELVIARLSALSQLHLAFEHFRHSKQSDMSSFIDSLPILQFRSLSIDALQTWHNQSDEQELSDAEPSLPENLSIPERSVFPAWFRASLRYCIEESQLTETHKRNLVFLSARDKLYGQKPKEKCVFLPLNWQQDKHKLIKVRSERNIWETSFAELASSRPLELLNLFTQNDVWVEGPFDALHSA